jgi:hypothetical protein
MGARKMLGVQGVAIVYCYWANEQYCDEVILFPGKAAQLLKKASIDDFSIWYGDNGGQITIDIDAAEGDQIGNTDINIVGDANPAKTLWFVLEEDEWDRVPTLYNHKQLVADALEDAIYKAGQAYENLDAWDSLEELYGDCKMIDTYIEVKL